MYLRVPLDNKSTRVTLNHYLNIIDDTYNFNIKHVNGNSNSKMNNVTEYILTNNEDAYIITLFKTYYSNSDKCLMLSYLDMNKKNLNLLLQNNINKKKICR